MSSIAANHERTQMTDGAGQHFALVVAELSGVESIAMDRLIDTLHARAGQADDEEPERWDGMSWTKTKMPPVGQDTAAESRMQDANSTRANQIWPAASAVAARHAARSRDLDLRGDLIPYRQGDPDRGRCIRRLSRLGSQEQGVCVGVEKSGSHMRRSECKWVDVWRLCIPVWLYLKIKPKLEQESLA